VSDIVDLRVVDGESRRWNLIFINRMTLIRFTFLFGNVNAMTPHLVYILKNYINRMRCHPVYNLFANVNWMTPHPVYTFF